MTTGVIHPLTTAGSSLHSQIWAHGLYTKVNLLKKLKGMPAFVSSSLSNLPFLALLCFFLVASSGLKAFRSREIKVHMCDLVQSIEMIFIINKEITL